MFLDYYGLREQPFGVTPDPRYLYLSSSHREALSSLFYAIETNRGFSALIAEPGMGKTSLLFRMLETLKGSARTAFLFQTEGDSRELLRSLLHDLGISVSGQDPVAMHDALNEGLLQELQAGRQVVVVIDEAQNLDGKVLETIRLLSNFETSTQKLMHIVLAGQPGLATKLCDPGMMQLRQRVSTIIRLEPFRDEEIVKYVQHRLRAAGHAGPSIFTPDAFEIIGRISKGIPRNINSLCFQALSLGFANQSKQIGANIIREVASDHNFSPEDFTPRWNDRVRIPEAPRWPPPSSVDTPHYPASTRLGVWESAGVAPPRPSGMKWGAAIACLAIVPAVVIAFSDSRFGLSETLPGQVSGKMVNAVLDSKDPNADFSPGLPDRLKPPQPPPAAQDLTPVTSSPTSSPNDQLGSASQGDSDPREIPTQANGGKSSQQVSPAKQRETPAAGEKQKAPYDNRNEAYPPHTGIYGAPTRVQILRAETVFQFAQELYGQSNWIVVQAICAANPGIHDPYSVLTPGQWIRLPSDLVTVTANYNSRAPVGGSR